MTNVTGISNVMECKKDPQNPVHSVQNIVNRRGTLCGHAIFVLAFFYLWAFNAFKDSSNRRQTIWERGREVMRSGHDTDSLCIVSILCHVANVIYVFVKKYC